jgi:hypothetical protein
MVPTGLVYSIRDSTEEAIKKMIEASQTNTFNCKLLIVAFASLTTMWD